MALGRESGTRRTKEKFSCRYVYYILSQLLDVITVWMGPGKTGFPAGPGGR